MRTSTIIFSLIGLAMFVTWIWPAPAMTNHVLGAAYLVILYMRAVAQEKGQP